ncbi:hypothetical protein EVAR_16702_1 [Eumeta japonica]|uniref:Uncharacterized protein n=1 Tax=Eumeta variegata TaxID=151549 RepID=A0A4C1V5M4_EUMVA|nr:hypothetical protein EVAR_16702_1 [Eumeta japonica]
MSFVTKREKVFEPDLLVELPARSEGKIKNYSSCTDARAWSHHTTDQTEHLMENIRRNTCICRPKYLSTEVIVKTLTTSKNKEIAKLKRKIAQLEEMLAAYDCLDLSCAQKCEIAKAHESIKACYQDLNDMSLELDLSGFTEGVDSETFETGKSGGDTTDRSCCTRSMDSRKRRSDVKFTNMGDSSMPSCKCDKATSARDKSCTELEQIIKQKDAKLKSLQNTIKIMENDSCEPYCVYAHIYTALEKIFCVLSQNEKYREYLFLLRALLAADIMETEEFKEILDQEKEMIDENMEMEDNSLMIEEYDIDKKNLNRLILLQRNYDELIICYENVKDERDFIQNKYFKYEELENELQMLRDQLSKFDNIKLERDEYQTRLDELNTQYIDLSEETLNFKMQLKAESEINVMKTNKIAELRNENIELEKKINDIEMKYRKEKNSLQCKIMEMECKMMCQEQQIKSLTEQIDRLVKENNEKPTRDTPEPIELLKEMSALKTQVNRLKEMLCSKEEEKKSIEEEFNNGLEIINALKREIGAWKERYENTLKRNDNLENYAEDSRKEIDRLITLSKNLSNENTEKSEAVENLLNVIKNKSLEINRLLNEIGKQKNENRELCKQSKTHSHTETVYQCEDTNSLDSIMSAEEDEYNDDVICDPNKVIQYLSTETDINKYNKFCERLAHKTETLQKFSGNLETENKILLQELKRLQDLNESTINDISKLENDKKEYSNKLELALKETKELERKLSEFQMLSSQMQKLQNSYDQLLNEKNEQETVMKNESRELSGDLKEFKSLKDSIIYLCQKLINGEMIVQTDVPCQNKEIENLMKHIEILQLRNQNLSQKYNVMRMELNHLKNRLEILVTEKNELQNEVEDKINSINKLHQLLEIETEKNKHLCNDIQNLRVNINENVKENLDSDNDNPSNLNSNSIVETLMKPDKSDEYEKLKKELLEAKKAYIEMESQKDKFLKRFEEQMYELKQIRIENQSLYDQKKNLIVQNANLENDLEELRNEIMAKACAPQFNCSVIVKETEQMKKEKLQSIKKNHELLEKIDEMDNAISDLSEQLLARTNKITILENYINALEDEIRKLQQSLGLAVSTGEQICYNGVKNKESALKIMDLNRSKIVRDLKKQIKKLQDENTTVEKQWFAIKLQLDELEREKNNNASEIICLKNERNVMLGEFREIEIKLIGDSMLLPQNTSLEEILTSIRRVMKCIEAKDAKNSTLEHTLMKVQTSSQLLLNKADEAKTIIEKEKLKMHNEKEEAVRDKLLMTKELSSLKEKLENQITVDHQIIKDLEAELLNHKLIIQNINKTKGNETNKFEKEMQYLHNMYKQSVLETKELRETLQGMIVEKEINQEKLNNSNKILNQRMEEINGLKEQLLEMRSKLDQISETETQTENIVSDINTTTQTVLNVCDFSSDTSDIKNNENSILNAHVKGSDTQLGDKNEDITSTQIVDKSLTIPCKDQSHLDDFLRCCITKKINKLSKGTLEQFSITTIASINCNKVNKTNEIATVQNYYDIWKDSPEQLVQHMIQKELNKKRSTIEVESNEMSITQNNKQEISFDNIENHKNFGTTTHTVNTVKQKLHLQNPNKNKNEYNHKNCNDSVTLTQFDNNFMKTTKDKLKLNVKDTQKCKKDKSIEVDIRKVELDNDGRELMSEWEYIPLNNDTAQADAFDDYNNDVVSRTTRKLPAETQNETNVLYTNEAVMRPTNDKETTKNQEHQIGNDKIPTKIKESESKQSAKTLVATKVVAVEIKPAHLHDECVCVYGLNASAPETKGESAKDDRERVYSTHIAQKVLNKDIEELDVDELKFLHSKVCQSWRSKLKSDKALAKRLEILEGVKHPGHDLKNVTRCAHLNRPAPSSEARRQSSVAQVSVSQVRRGFTCPRAINDRTRGFRGLELQRKVREERQRLLEFRKAVFRTTPIEMQTGSPEPRDILAERKVLNPNTLRPHLGELRSLFNNAERDTGHPLNKSWRLTDDTAPGLRAKVNAYRTSHGRQLTEDKHEVRERRGGTTNEQPARIRRAGVGRPHKK